jgi:PAS domain S-box-containing protein
MTVSIRASTGTKTKNKRAQLIARLSQLEEELEETKHELNHSFDAAEHGIRVINRDFTVRVVNRAFSEMFGIDQRSAIGKKCWQIFTGPFCDTPDCRLRRILSGERRIQAEILRKKLDGNEITCKVFASPVYGKKGEINGVIEQFHDISENILLKEKAQESEKLIKALVNIGTSTGEAIMILQDVDGIEGRYVFMNGLWPKLTGYTRQELLNMSAFDLISHEYMDAARKRYRNIITGKAIPRLIEVYITSKSGTNIPVELTIAPIVYHGQHSALVSLRDISERKVIEAKLEKERNKYFSLLQKAPVAIWEMDYSEGMLTVNNLKAMGVTDFEHYFYEYPKYLVKFLKGYKVIHSNDAAAELIESNNMDTPWKLVQKIARNLRNGKSNVQEASYLRSVVSEVIKMIKGNTEHQIHEFPIQTASGDFKYVLSYTCVMPGHEHDLSWVQYFAFDISKRIQIENELKQYQQHLEEMVKKRTAQLERSRRRERKLFSKECDIRRELEEQIESRHLFTRALVHELKSPLMPIMGASEVLSQEIHEEPYLSYAKAIYRGSCQLEKRVDELMDIARGEIGILRLKQSHFNPLELLNEIAEFIKVKSLDSHHQIRIEFPESMKALWADYDRLHEVFTNIIDNAFRYTPDGGVITLRASETDTQAIFEVMDTGIGMDKKTQKRLFKPYEIARGNAYCEGGLGLGLSLCKVLVELHHGQIAISSQKNKGTSVIFTIPFTPESDEAEELAAD